MKEIYRNGTKLYEMVYFEPHIMTDKNKIQFDSDGGTEVITVASDSDWTATTTSTWFTITQGNDILTVSAPASDLELEGTITITAMNEFGAVKTVSVSVIMSEKRWVLIDSNFSHSQEIYALKFPSTRQTESFRTYFFGYIAGLNVYTSWYNADTEEYGWAGCNRFDMSYSSLQVGQFSFANQNGSYLYTNKDISTLPTDESGNYVFEMPYGSIYLSGGQRSENMSYIGNYKIMALID